MLRKFNFFNYLQIRSIVSSPQCCGHSKAVINMNKQVKMMKKIMVGREKGARRYREQAHPKLPEPTKLSSTEKQGKEANRRVTVLNKLFMKHITDMMSCGEIAEKIFGYGIQVTTTKVASDFRSLNVYWMANGGTKSIDDKNIDVILRSIAGPLRHELSVLRVMGEVPQINFLRDSSIFRAGEVDALLKRADFGEDFEPTDPTLFMKDQIKLEVPLPEELRVKIRELDATEVIDEDIIEDFPEMRHDMFHVDHAKIMGAVVANMSKTAKAWEVYNSNEPISDTDRQLAIEKLTVTNKKLDDQKETREEFMNFLVRKQYEKKFKSEGRQTDRYALNLDDDNGQFEEFIEQLPDNDFFYDETEDKK